VEPQLTIPFPPDFFEALAQRVAEILARPRAGTSPPCRHRLRHVVRALVAFNANEWKIAALRVVW
jgi:hypothetical protein